MSPSALPIFDKHGMDFAEITAEFFTEALILSARDSRFRAIGCLAGGTIVVVFAVLGDEAISIISMRPASKAERRLLT